MTAPTDTPRAWLRNEATTVLRRNVSPLTIALGWRPESAWGDLEAAAAAEAFEFCSGLEHELVLSARLTSPPATRSVPRDFEVQLD